MWPVRSRNAVLIPSLLYITGTDLPESSGAERDEDRPIPAADLKRRVIEVFLEVS